VSIDWSCGLTVWYAVGPKNDGNNNAVPYACVGYLGTLRPIWGLWIDEPNEYYTYIPLLITSFYYRCAYHTNVPCHTKSWDGTLSATPAVPSRPCVEPLPILHSLCTRRRKRRSTVGRQLSWACRRVSVHRYPHTV
jgi:hypothetical protein